MKRAFLVAPVLLLSLLAGCASTGGAGDDSSGQWPAPMADADNDCQRTRTEVLLRDLQGLVQWADPMACDVAGGEWHSWGREAALDIRNVQVVPLVPVDNAMRSGAADWPGEKKRAFMNDMDNLIILDRFSVQERDGHGPDRWVPLQKHWCEYAQRWETVKQRYGLRMSEEERGAVDRMKAECETAPAPEGQAG